jgi:hypothetical protein
VAPPGNQAANREDKLQPIAMEGPGLLDNVQLAVGEQALVCPPEADKPLADQILNGKK